MELRFRLIALNQALLMVLCLVLFTSPSHAAVYACQVASGKTVYQDRPCPKAPSEPAIGTAKGVRSSNSADGGEYPFGMHKSWFAKPLRAPQPAYCDRLGCDCSRQTRNFRHGLPKAVADALFLETAWHRYAELVIELENNPPTGYAKLELEVGIEESACDIQMSQLTVLNYANEAMDELKERAEAAISRNNTDLKQCDGTDEKVCADVDAVGLYYRVMQDIETLTLPRYSLIADAE